jgi:hypothetical protein
MRSSRGESFLRTAALVTECLERGPAAGFFAEDAGFFADLTDEDVEEDDAEGADESCALTKRVHAKHNTNAKRKIRDNCL